MPRPMLFAAVLAGCLNVAAAAEANDRHGQMRSFAHQSFGHGQQSFGHGQPLFGHGQQSFGHGQPSFGHGQPSFGLGHRHDSRWSGRSSGPWAFASPRHHPGFAPRFDHRPRFSRFGGRQFVPPLSTIPGHRIFAGRRILPFVGRPARLARPFVTVRPHRFPTFVRVFPGPAFGFRHDGFGVAHAGGGLTIIVREAPGIPHW
jgi:hypothetical protein